MSISLIELSCFAFSVMFYAAGVFKAAGLPTEIRRRVILRSSTFVLNFTVTYGFRVLLDSLSTLMWHGKLARGLDALSLDAISLNGAGNILTYMFWMWYRKRLAADSLLGAPLALEQLIIDRYFDLDLCSDEMELEARQSIAISVAGLRQTMQAGVS